MIVDGRYITDTLDKMYRASHMADFMREAYDYCLKHEAAIRAHIEESEKTF